MIAKMYITAEDVMELLGCKKTMAYNVIRETNKYAESKKVLPFGQGKASKYLFSEMYGLPLEDVNAVLEEKDEKKKEKNRSQKKNE